MTNNFAIYSVKILGEISREIFYFPMWWYSRGFLTMTKGTITFLRDREKSLALLVWIKNIHKPMYGQADWQGMLISVFIRIIQIIFRSIVMLVYITFALVAIVLWVTLPFIVFYEIIFQLGLV